ENALPAAPRPRPAASSSTPDLITNLLISLLPFLFGINKPQLPESPNQQTFRGAAICLILCETANADKVAIAGL
ncbi:MAG: hypothetical protein ACK5JI_12595, partial [Azonexus sp.]